MRVAMLTGGGDCPGLNAVMRAVARKGERIYGDELVGLRDGWRGAVEGDLVELSVRVVPGHAAAWRHDPRFVAHQPLQARRRPRGGQGHPGRARHRRPGRHRRRGHAGRRRPSRRGGRGGRRRAQDDRQRPVGDRAHVRLRHGRAGVRRRDRPPAHHRRVARPGDGRRGDGPPRRAHRHVGGHRRRSDHGARARAHLRHRRGVPGDPAPPRGRALRLDHRGRRGRSARQGTLADGVGRGRRLRPRPARRHRRPARPGHRGRAPATRPGPSCSATSSGAARRPPSTGCWPRASASVRSTPCTPATSARWWPCGPATSCGCRWPTPPPSSSSSIPTIYDVAQVFFGWRRVAPPAGPAGGQPARPAPGSTRRGLAVGVHGQAVGSVWPSSHWASVGRSDRTRGRRRWRCRAWRRSSDEGDRAGVAAVGGHRVGAGEGGRRVGGGGDGEQLELVGLVAVGRARRRWGCRRSSRRPRCRRRSRTCSESAVSTTVARQGADDEQRAEHQHQALLAAVGPAALHLGVAGEVARGAGPVTEPGAGACRTAAVAARRRQGGPAVTRERRRHATGGGPAGGGWAGGRGRRGRGAARPPAGGGGAAGATAGPAGAAGGGRWVGGARGGGGGGEGRPPGGGGGAVGRAGHRRHGPGVQICGRGARRGWLSATRPRTRAAGGGGSVRPVGASAPRRGGHDARRRARPRAWGGRRPPRAAPGPTRPAGTPAGRGDEPPTSSTWSTCPG